MRIALGSSFAALALSGCIVPVGFDPVGDASSMQGSWTVAGASPTVASCGEVAYVRVRFFEGEEHRDHHDLVFECALGGFDTRPERVVAEGAWQVALVAIRADGSVVEQGPTHTVDTRAEGGGHLAIPPFDLRGAG